MPEFGTLFTHVPAFPQIGLKIAIGCGNMSTLRSFNTKSKGIFWACPHMPGTALVLLDWASGNVINHLTNYNKTRFSLGIHQFVFVVPSFSDRFFFCLKKPTNMLL